MNWKEFFKLSKAKLFIFLGLIVINFIVALFFEDPEVKSRIFFPLEVSDFFNHLFTYTIQDFGTCAIPFCHQISTLLTFLISTIIYYSLACGVVHIFKRK